VLRNVFYKARRTFASSLLVLLQVHLLGIAMLHWHADPLTPEHGLRVDNSAVQPSPASEGNMPCTACQIVQNGAARPALVAQVLPLSTSVPLIRLTASSIYHSEFSAMSYGRAPPVA
jgi:hypothetical protein